MNTDQRDASNPLKGLGEASKAKGPPPVHLWNPPFCGDIDMRIAQDGTWFYMNSPIGRKPLVQLFASVLRHDEDGKFYLVTPVEKVGIRVDDAPFTAIRMRVEGEGRDQVIRFETNVDDEVTVDARPPPALRRGRGHRRPQALCAGPRPPRGAGEPRPVL